MLQALISQGLPVSPLSPPPLSPVLRHKIILYESDVADQGAVLREGHGCLAGALLENVRSLLQIAGEGPLGQEGGWVEDGEEVVGGQEGGVGDFGGGGSPGCVGGGGGRGDDHGVEHRSVPEGGKGGVGEEKEDEGQGANKREDNAKDTSGAGPSRREAAGGTMVMERGGPNGAGEEDGGRGGGMVGGIHVRLSPPVFVVGMVVARRNRSGGERGG